VTETISVSSTKPDSFRSCVFVMDVLFARTQKPGPGEKPDPGMSI
jgi:hypothetical protein